MSDAPSLDVMIERWLARKSTEGYPRTAWPEYEQKRKLVRRSGKIVDVPDDDRCGVVPLSMPKTRRRNYQEREYDEVDEFGRIITDIDVEDFKLLISDWYWRCVLWPMSLTRSLSRSRKRPLPPLRSYADKRRLKRVRLNLRRRWENLWMAMMTEDMQDVE